jgi:hypothetical protein
VLAVVVTGVAAAGPVRKRPTCFPEHSRTVASTKDVRVFSVITHPRDEGEVAYATVTYGCLLRRKRPLKLGSVDPKTLVIQGHRIAFYTWWRYSAEHCYGEAGVSDLDTRSSRRFRERDNANAPVRIALGVGGTMAFALPLDNSCRLYGNGSPPPQWEVRTYGPTGLQRLDVSPDIDPNSIAVAGHWLYWMRAGEPRSARIDP